MLFLDRPPSPRPGRVDRRRARHLAEPLESRRLLSLSPSLAIVVLPVAVAAPVPGLVSGIGLAASASSQPSATVSVSPTPSAAPAMAAGSSPTGPSTTLSPLPTEAETAAAASSEVARPTPGRSDRIASFLPTPEVLETSGLRSPDPAEAMVPEPSLPEGPAAPPGDRPPAPADVPRADPPAEPAPPPRQLAPPAPELAPATPKDPVTLEVWDAALLEVVTADRIGAQADSTAWQVDGRLAAGAALAFWGGREFVARRQGRSRRRPILVASGVDAGRA